MNSYHSEGRLSSASVSTPDTLKSHSETVEGALELHQNPPKSRLIFAYGVDPEASSLGEPAVLFCHQKVFVELEPGERPWPSLIPDAHLSVQGRLIEVNPSDSSMVELYGALNGYEQVPVVAREERTGQFRTAVAYVLASPVSKRIEGGLQ
jgi:hypothetical protein